MHTQSKWEYKERIIDEHNKIYDIYVEDMGRIASTTVMPNKEESKANAKHIVQMHNSFPDLLEALKKALYWDSLSNQMPAPVKHRLETAIAKAEENN